MKVNSFNQEFGYELLSSVPYAYQLYLDGKLTQTESGPDTKALYYFSPKHIENRDKRNFENVDKAREAGLPYTEIHHYERPDLKFPPYKKIYGGLQYWDKPTLCICNRYATMWGSEEPVNFFDEHLLDWMFSQLKDLYHIVYFPVSIPMEFEDGEKNMVMNDIEIAMKHDVDVFTHIKGKSWNESMLKIFAGCEHFITMNGGYSILASLFGGTNIIYSKQCYELEFKSFWRWYPNHSDQRCLHVDNYKELKAKIKALYIDKLPQVNVIIKTNKKNYFRGCIESVLEQDYPNINPVVITTGEESVKYTRKYKARHLEGDWKGRVSGYIIELDEDYKFIRRDAVSTLMDGVKDGCINTGRVQLPGKIYGGKKLLFKCSLDGCEGEINLLDEVILMKQKNVPEIFEDEIIDEEEEKLYDEMLDKMLEDMDRLDEEEKEYQMKDGFRNEEFKDDFVLSKDNEIKTNYSFRGRSQLIKDGFKKLDPNQPIFNILIRTSGRPNYFIGCMDSIYKQSYTNYNVIVGIDRDDSMYATNYDCSVIKYDFSDVDIKPKRGREYGEPFVYNLYFNELHKWVDEGYILYIDDDDALNDDDALLKISEKIKEGFDLIFYKCQFPKDRVIPLKFGDPVLFDISTLNFCFNSKIKPEWEGYKFGDYRVANYLYNVVDNKGYIDGCLTKVQREVAVGGGKRDDKEKNNFQCIITRNFPNSSIFFPVQQAMIDVFGNDPNYNDTLLLLGYNIGCDIDKIKKKYKNKKIVIYQLEQLFDNKSQWYNIKSQNREVIRRTNHIKNVLSKCDEIWDYDLDNIEFLKSEGFTNKIVHVPLPYSSKLKRVNNNKNPEYDILFYGSLNDRRLKFLEALKDYKLIIITNSDDIKKFKNSTVGKCMIENKYNNELFEYIFNSKIILNIHYYESKIQEQVRIFELLINNKTIVSEKSRINYYNDMIYEFETIEEMINIINSLIWWKNESISNEFRIKTSKKKDKNFKVGAAYNTFYGIELLEKSIKSIRPVVDYVVVVHQKISFSGNEEDPINNVLFKKLLDDKLIDDIVYYDVNTSTQGSEGSVLEKRNIGLEYCRQNNCDFIIPMDADERYDKNELLNELNYMYDNEIETLYSPIHSYYYDENHYFVDTYYVPCALRINERKFERTLSSVLVDPVRKMKEGKYKISKMPMHHFTYIKDIYKHKVNNSIFASVNPTLYEKLKKINDYLQKWKHGMNGLVFTNGPKGGVILTDIPLITIKNKK